MGLISPFFGQLYAGNKLVLISNDLDFATSRLRSVRFDLRENSPTLVELNARHLGQYLIK